MAKLLKLRRGTTTQHASFTGAEGEVTIDTTKDTAVVHDGSQAGGRPLAREDMSNVSSANIAGQLGTDSIATTKIAGGALPTDVTVASANIVDGTIVNADVNASAAIAGTKVAPDFGSQNLTTTGTLGSSDMTVTSTEPTITFTDSNSNPDFKLRGVSGQFRVTDITNGADRLVVNTDGHIDIAGNLDVGAGLDVTGNITATGKLDIGGSSGAAIEVPSNRSISLGNSGEFFIVHSNTGYSQIKESGSDNLYIDSTNIYMRDANAQTKLQTSSSGISVTGNIAVSGTVDGRDVAADGTKLDGIESSATADQTAAEIRTLVESASDSNVFTDADHTKLNGIEASATADQSNAEIRAAVEAASDSNVFTDADHSKLNGIETSATADQTAGEIVSLVNGQTITPAHLDVGTGRIGGDTTDYFAFTNNTRCDLFVNNSNEFRFEADGDFHADGNVTAYSTTISSDRKLKENIKVVPNALDKVQALNGVTFDWKKDNTPSAGVIAQDVIEVLPEAVKEVQSLKGGDSHLSVNYHALTSILIEAIKELKAEVDELKGGK
jgi:hypothetical protein